jgi:hypothetical protein
MMKRLTTVLLLTILTLVAGCGADAKTINGTHYDTFGLFSLDEESPDVHYKLSGMSIVWSIVFSETLIVPIYFIGFDLYEPVRLKDTAVKGGQ